MCAGYVPVDKAFAQGIRIGAGEGECGVFLKEPSQMRKKNVIWKLLFLFYIAILLYVLLFAERNTHGLNGYNIRLFAEIKRYIVYREILGMQLVLQNLLGNVIGFLPFGFFLPQLNRRFDKLFKITLTGFFFSLMIEGIQLVSGVGCFDVDDIFLNTLGGFIGAAGFIIFNRIRKKYGNQTTTEKV